MFRCQLISQDFCSFQFYLLCGHDCWTDIVDNLNDGYDCTGRWNVMASILYDRIPAWRDYWEIFFSHSRRRGIIALIVLSSFMEFSIPFDNLTWKYSILKGAVGRRVLLFFGGLGTVWAATAREGGFEGPRTWCFTAPHSMSSAPARSATIHRHARCFVPDHAWLSLLIKNRECLRQVKCLQLCIFQWKSFYPARYWSC